MSIEDINQKRQRELKAFDEDLKERVKNLHKVVVENPPKPKGPSQPTSKEPLGTVPSEEQEPEPPDA